jgi:hypothetical protein
MSANEEALTEILDKQADRIAELEAALKYAHDWLNRYGEHAPVLFGGETELEVVICTALYGKV